MHSSMIIAISISELTQLKNSFFTKFSERNKSLKQSVFQDKFSQLITNSNRKWSSLISSEDKSQVIELPLFEMKHSELGFNADELFAFQQSLYPYIKPFSEWTVIERKSPLLYAYIHEWDEMYLGRPDEIRHGYTSINFDFKNKSVYLTFLPFQFDGIEVYAEQSNNVLSLQFPSHLGLQAITHFIESLEKRLSTVVDVASLLFDESTEVWGFTSEESIVDPSKGSAFKLMSKQVNNILKQSIKIGGLVGYRFARDTSQTFEIIVEEHQGFKYQIFENYSELWGIKNALLIKNEQYEPNLFEV